MLATILQMEIVSDANQDSRLMEGPVLKYQLTVPPIQDQHAMPAVQDTTFQPVEPAP